MSTHEDFYIIMTTRWIITQIVAPVRQYISMDFITSLPLHNGYGAIVTFVCTTFTQHSHFIPPCNMSIDASQPARMFLDSIYCHYCLCRAIISDRDPRLTSAFLQNMLRPRKTKFDTYSSAYHSQTSGQAERTRRTIEQNILSSFIHNNHDDRLNTLSLAGFK